MLRNVLFFLILTSWLQLQAQHQPYRIAADFSSKEKLPNGQYSLQIGRLYYDTKIQKLCMALSFPTKEIILNTTDAQYIVENDLIKSKQLIPNVLSQSIFHLVLTGNLKTFGLNELSMEIEDVSQENDLTITTWISTAKKSQFKGKIVVSLKDSKLFGVAVLDEEGVMTNRYIFQNYQRIGEIEFPTKVIQTSIVKEIEYHKLIEYKNILVNEQTSQVHYNYPIPKN